MGGVTGDAPTYVVPNGVLSCVVVNTLAVVARFFAVVDWADCGVPFTIICDNDNAPLPYCRDGRILIYLPVYPFIFIV